MKKILIAIAAIFCFAVTSVFARTRPVMADYEGKAQGKEIPSWVKKVVNGEKHKLPELMPELENKKIFTIASRANNLETAKSKANVDILNEICGIIETIIFSNSEPIFEVQNKLPSDNYNLELKTNSLIIFDNEHFINNKSTDYSEWSYNYTYGNLPDSFEKACSFWTKINKVDDNNIIIDTYYEYYLVYTVDKDLWNKIMADHLNGRLSTSTIQPIDIQAHSPKKVDHSSYNINVYINPDNKDELVTFSSPDEVNDNKYYFKAYKRGYDLDKLRQDTEFYDIRQNLTNFISDVNLSKILKKSFEVWFDVDLKDGTKPFIDYFVQWEIDKDDFVKYMDNTINNNIYNFTNYN